MIGSWKWNVIISVAGAALLFFLSISSNPPVTSWYRAGISFVVLFATTYAVRWMLGEALRKPPAAREEDAPEHADESGKGRMIDVSTPDDANDLQSEFLPMRPPKLVTNDGAADAERLAQAIRHMSEK